MRHRARREKGRQRAKETNIDRDKEIGQKNTETQRQNLLYLSKGRDERDRDKTKNPDNKEKERERYLTFSVYMNVVVDIFRGETSKEEREKE